MINDCKNIFYIFTHNIWFSESIGITFYRCRSPTSSVNNSDNLTLTFMLVRQFTDISELRPEYAIVHTKPAWVRLRGILRLVLNSWPHISVND